MMQLPITKCMMVMGQQTSDVPALNVPTVGDTSQTWSKAYLG